MISAFHDVRFPVNLSVGAVGGPRRSTEVVEMVSGREQRNARQKHSRRRYNAGYGMKGVDDLYQVVAFFEERRGKLCGFRFQDPFDHKSSMPSQPISATDQVIGVGDGQTSVFQLVKHYGSTGESYVRNIVKPVQGSVMIAIDGTVKTEGADFDVEYSSGQVDFDVGSVPQSGEEITAGFLFDVPVRFDLDEIAVNLKSFQAGEIPSIPLFELLS